MFSLLLSSLSWAQDSNCDTAALSKIIMESVGDQVTESFISLADCAPAEAKKVSERAIEKFYPGSTGSRGIVAAAKLGLYTPIQVCNPFWLDLISRPVLNCMFCLHDFPSWED